MGSSESIQWMRERAEDETEDHEGEEKSMRPKQMDWKVSWGVGPQKGTRPGERGREREGVNECGVKEGNGRRGTDAGEGEIH